jgi:hypothetical protein
MSFNSNVFYIASVVLIAIGLYYIIFGDYESTVYMGSYEDRYIRSEYANTHSEIYNKDEDNLEEDMVRIRIPNSRFNYPYDDDNYLLQ